MPELLLLLLPVAAFSGWLVGRRQLTGPKTDKPTHGELSRDYFQGLNHLLNEQPDKAIEVFTRLVEVDSDTAETHLALGNLFRRQGEVDRAIRIHQNLIARPSLDRDNRGNALLDLAKDYRRAGLLDRAESLFREAAELDEHAETALRNLLEIYQQEKEWDSAIDAAQRLETRTGVSYRREAAQCACEQAEEARRDDADEATIQASLKRALGLDPSCVRANILRGELKRRQGQPRSAIRAYQRVRRQDIDYLPEVIPLLEICYRELGQPARLRRYLDKVLSEYEGVSVVMKISELITERHGRKAAVRFLAAQLRRRPSVRGLNRLVELSIDDTDSDERRQRDLRVLRDLFAALIGDRTPYRCHACGFEARQLHWLCPTCRAWGTIKPTKGVQGE